MVENNGNLKGKKRRGKRVRKLKEKNRWSEKNCDGKKNRFDRKSLKIRKDWKAEAERVEKKRGGRNEFRIAWKGE